MRALGLVPEAVHEDGLELTLQVVTHPADESEAIYVAHHRQRVSKQQRDYV